jgi:hypothetical protein
LPIGKKPYQGELLIFLLHDGVFNGAKSIGVRFSARFVEIARNKCNCPEVPIPLLALVATAVMSFPLSLHAMLIRFLDLRGPFLEDAWFTGKV